MSHSPLNTAAQGFMDPSEKGLGLGVCVETWQAKLLTPSRGHREEQKQHQHQDSCPYAFKTVLGSDFPQCFFDPLNPKHQNRASCSSMSKRNESNYAPGGETCTLMSAP